MSSNNPIGLFDSGIGGISVLRRIREALPRENFSYIADTAHLPYGDKPSKYIEERCIALTEFLLGHNAKAIVVACNTATAASIATLRARFSIPIIGIEPGVKPALAKTQTGVVGVLATIETLKSRKFETLISRFCNDGKVEFEACSGLVEQVEAMDLLGENTRKLVEKYVFSLLDKKVDTIVLGCTHYPLLLELIKDVAGKNITIIDTGVAVAKEVQRRLTESQLLSNKKTKKPEPFWTSGDPQKMQNIMDLLWNDPVEVLKLPNGV